MTTQAEMLFDAEMSAKYHRRRASFLERASAFMSFVILFGGAGAFASLFSDQTVFAKALTVLITLVGVIQIVFRTDSCAAQHRQWLRNWNEMLSEIRSNIAADQDTVAAWQRRKYILESECVGEMRALQEDCYNRTMVSLRLEGSPTKITRWQRLWMQLCSFENSFQKTP